MTKARNESPVARQARLFLCRYYGADSKTRVTAVKYVLQPRYHVVAICTEKGPRNKRDRPYEWTHINRSVFLAFLGTRMLDPSELPPDVPRLTHAEWQSLFGTNRVRATPAWQDLHAVMKGTTPK